jgi:saxitoxin biosynthesis operon SxtJ-like protein
MSHESLDRSEAIQGASNRALGLTFGAVLLIVGLYPWAFGNPVRWWSIVASTAFVLVAFVVPGVLGPLNKAWTRLGLLLHRITSPIVLGIMFFAVVTPTGLLMRLLGKDLLRLRMEPDSPSYWIDRQPPGPKPDTLPNQF